EAREDEVVLTRERMRLCVGFDERHRAEAGLARAFACPLEHRTGDVDAGHPPRDADVARECEARVAAPAPDVDDALTVPRRSPFERAPPEGRKHCIEQRLLAHPSLAPCIVPKAYLLGVRSRQIHAAFYRVACADTIDG